MARHSMHMVTYRTAWPLEADSEKTVTKKLPLLITDRRHTGIPGRKQFVCEICEDRQNIKEAHKEITECSKDRMKWKGNNVDVGVPDLYWKACDQVLNIMQLCKGKHPTLAKGILNPSLINASYLITYLAGGK